MDISDRKGEGNGTPLQYSCPENPMDGGAWQAAVHGVAKRWERLSDFTFTFHFHALKKEMATHSSVLAWRISGTGSLMGCRLGGCTESDTTEAAQQQQQQQQRQEKLFSFSLSLLPETTEQCFSKYGLWTTSNINYLEIEWHMLIPAPHPKLMETEFLEWSLKICTLTK